MYLLLYLHIATETLFCCSDLRIGYDWPFVKVLSRNIQVGAHVFLRSLVEAHHVSIIHAPSVYLVVGMYQYTVLPDWMTLRFVIIVLPLQSLVDFE
jgi:hypothetical protein